MSELPDNWIEARLDECALFNPKHPFDADRSIEVSFVPMPAVNEHSGSIERQEVRQLSEVWSGYTHFQEGDVIFAKITPCMENGKAAVARQLKNGLACGSTEFHVLRPRDGVLAEYLWRFLRQETFRKDAEQSMTGAVGQRRVPADFLRSAKLPLPPKSEQRRIVAKIDRLSAKSKRARDQLDQVPRLAEKYKQAILAAAFRGELTREWRASRVQRGSSYDWSKRPLVDVCDPIRPITYGVIKLGSETENGTPCLRTSNVRWLRIDTDGIKKISPTLSSEYSRTILRGGEVLINVRGTLGGVAVATPEMRGWNVSREVAVAPIDQAIINPQYAAYWIGADASQRWLNRVEKGVAYTGINIEDLRKLPIEFPSLQEQDAIVRHIEAAFTWISRLVSEASRARQLIDNLDQAIFAKAFQGELVPQDPNAEPASTCLERIEADRPLNEHDAYMERKKTTPARLSLPSSRGGIPTASSKRSVARRRTRAR